jgi:hypothetical protein
MGYASLTKWSGAKRCDVELFTMGSSDLIPVSVAVERLQREGLLKSASGAALDVLQGLRDHELSPKPKSVGRKGYGYTTRQFEHIRNVLLIQRELGPKWSYEELAFWMAAQKLRDVPPHLVAAHIERGFKLFFSGMERIVERAPTGRKVNGSSHSVRSFAKGAAQRMARFAVRQMLATAGVRDNAQSVDLTTALLQFVLNLWHFQIPLAKLSADLRHIIYEVYEEGVADERFAYWYDWLSRNESMFSKKLDANLVVQAVRKALRKNPKLVLLGAHDALLGVMLLKKWPRTDAEPEPRITKSNETLYMRVVRDLIPVFAGISIEVQLKDSRSELLQRLRRGEDLGFPEFVKRLEVRGQAALAGLRGGSETWTASS